MDRRFIVAAGRLSLAILIGSLLIGQGVLGQEGAGSYPLAKTGGALNERAERKRDKQSLQPPIVTQATD